MTKRVILIISTLLIIGGCTNKRASYPTCKNDTDCQNLYSGNFTDGHCYMGKCEQCVNDDDCGDSGQCINYRCESTCQMDSDCNTYSYCDESVCVSDCKSQDDCSYGESCHKGRCMQKLSSASLDDSYMQAKDENSCQNLSRVNFDFDRFDIKSDYTDGLSKIITCLNENPSFQIIISGHTDEVGTPSYNMLLGERRANAVKNYLVTKGGITGSRVRTLSFGEQRPLVSASDNYAYSQNRRAEFEISTQGL